MANTSQMAAMPGTRTDKKKPTKLGSMAGDLTKHLDRHFTPIRHNAGAIIAPGARNTQDVAVATPTESGVSFCPEFTDTAQCRIHGFGQDGRIGNNRRTATSVFRTSCHPPCDRRKLQGVFKSHVGAIMAHANSTPTPTSGTTNHAHIALTQHATERLAMALFLLRNGKSTTSLQRATGLVYAAGRALSQVVGGAHHV